MSWKYMSINRWKVTVLSLLLISVFYLTLLPPQNWRVDTDDNDRVTLPESAASDPLERPRLHVLLPASNTDINLCKTLLGAKALDYPEPVLVGWNEARDTEYLLGGGSHIVKISKVLQYLQDMPTESDNDLVLMMDAFDIWFQLRPETLIDRYYAINRQANRRILDRMGNAANIEAIEQKIIFGAGKRCAPNQVHTIACYPVPDSPIARDIYGGNTDTIMGRNKYTSLRQRFLNSGYVIGPAKDMRRLFERAWQKVQDWPNPDPEDNGSHGSDFMYHGSDQSVFNVIFGEQEFQREVIRRRHLSWVDKLWKDGNPRNVIEGTIIGNDVLNPPFTHQKMEHFPGHPFEFGIGLDYYSQLGHQTANADFDGKWLRYSHSLSELREEARRDRNDFDCEYLGQGQIPEDITRAPPPMPASKDWNQVNLYTNLCLDTIPVMVHHNGDKSARERQWTELWLQPFAKGITSSALNAEKKAFGAKIYGGAFIGWEELCPAEFSEELFRG